MSLEQIPESSFLFYKSGGSDKVYQAHLRQKDAGWVVDYGNGPRGGTLRTGTKTSSPLDFLVAKKIYDKLVKEKTAGGYTPDQSGVLYTASDFAGRTSGELPQLPTAITEAIAETLLDDPEWGLQEKADGENRYVIVEGGTLRGTNRRGLFVDVPQHWSAPMSVGRTVLAGEHVGDRFHAFDLLECMGESYRTRPYIERFIQLEKIAKEIEWISPITLEVTSEGKRRRAAEIQAANGEGFVLKRLDAPFTPGRSIASLKFKFNESATCLVLRVNAQRSIAVGLRDEAGDWVDLGNVTIPANANMPTEGELVEVRYLYRFDGGKFEQPVFLGPRTDIGKEDALLSQITRIKARGQDANELEDDDETAYVDRPRG